ncbi:hypothetical protein GCM10007989_09300 [Devosia pacifica]|uniref:Uncharacterized protein n=1 Tax=Devosia pacifica TaxID=1335967 RepID=A0A918VQV9_9HYPH|nr:GNAT family N-acetyltransferase [Devosia pacifica]GHA16402.1 hypothetical protein GCM10007989_09300 [Devosia pacifica]
MQPHPFFKDRLIPSAHKLGQFELRALSVSDLDRDYSAVMESAAEIKAANPYSTWPEGLTRERNLIDLAWHQREFEMRRSFAWVIEDLAGTYLGCVYVYPSLTGERSADVRWWWRIGQNADQAAFRSLLHEWLGTSVWPPLSYHLQA